MSQDNHKKVMEFFRQRDALRNGLKYASECLFRIKETLGESPIGREIAAKITDEMRHIENSMEVLRSWIREAEEGEE